MSITLPSGRKIDPNGDIIGIDDKGQTWGGYDNYLEPRPDNIQYDEETPWSDADKLYLGRMMLERWKQYLAKIEMPEASAPVDIARIINDLIVENPEKWEQCKVKPVQLEWFLGHVMRLSGGKANPVAVREDLLRRIQTKNEMSDNQATVLAMAHGVTRNDVE